MTQLSIVNLVIIQFTNERKKITVHFNLDHQRRDSKKKKTFCKTNIAQYFQVNPRKISDQSEERGILV